MSPCTRMLIARTGLQMRSRLTIAAGQRRSQADRGILGKFCERLGQAAPAGRDKQHRISFDGGALRWEQHSEFTTYTFELPSKESRPFHPAASAVATVMAGIPQPGPVL